MSAFKKVWDLKQITPMLHFQVSGQEDEPGAIIRASELKPKLDRFLIAALSGKLEETPENWSGVGIQTRAGLWTAVADLISRDKIGKAWIQNYDQRPKWDKDNKLEIKDYTPDPALAYKLKIWAKDPSKRTVSKSEEEIVTLVSAKTTDEKHSDCWKKERRRIIEELKKTGEYPNEMYFGNMGEKGKKISTVLYKDEAKIQFQIFSLIPGLINAIGEDDIRLFFLCHNFGTRQTKGFGSFVVKATPAANAQAEISLLKERYPAFIYFSVPVMKQQSRSSQANNHNTALPRDVVCMNQARYLYALMKSGINLGNDYFKGYMFLYLIEKGFRNEKQSIKVNLLALTAAPLPVPPMSEARFGRALLGLAENYPMKYRSNRFDPDRGTQSIVRTDLDKTVLIMPEKEEIKRFASPLTIKITPNNVYFLPNYSYVRMFNQKINTEDRDWSSGSGHNRTHDFFTPKNNDEFDIIGFIQSFQQHYSLSQKGDDWYGSKTSIRDAQSSGLRFFKTLEVHFQDNRPAAPNATRDTM